MRSYRGRSQPRGAVDMTIFGVDEEIVDAARFLQQTVRPGLERLGLAVEFPRQRDQGSESFPCFQIAPLVGRQHRQDGFLLAAKQIGAEFPAASE